MKKVINFLLQIQLSALFLLVLSNVSFSATEIYEKKETILLKDSTDTIARYSNLRFRALYGSNLLFLGRQSSQKYPYLSSFISYKTASGLWASVSAFHINDYSPAIAETDIGVGWDFKFSKRTDASLNYSHFFYSSENPIVKSVVSDDIQFSMGFDWKIFYTWLAVDYILGEVNDFYLSFENDRYFEKELFKGKHLLTIDPIIGVYAGPQNISWSSKFQNKISGGKTSSAKGKSTKSAVAVTDIASSVFSVIYYQVSLPVTYYIRRWGLKLNCFYAVPVNNLEGDHSKAQLNYTLSLQYKIRFFKE